MRAVRHRADWTKLAQLRGDARTRGEQAGASIAVGLAELADVPRGTSKYRNRVTIRDGYRFHSVLEADRYSELKLYRATGELLYSLRQVPFVLAPGVTYRADFLNVWGPGALDIRSGATPVTVEDTKGFLTEGSRVKLALVERLYGVKVRVLKRADVQRFS